LSAACVRSFSQLTIEVIYKTSTPAAYIQHIVFLFKRCHLPENIMVDMLHMNLNFHASQKSYFKISEKKTRRIHIALIFNHANFHKKKIQLYVAENEKIKLCTPFVHKSASKIHPSTTYNHNSSLRACNPQQGVAPSSICISLDVRLNKRSVVTKTYFCIEYFRKPLSCFLVGGK
jgi:hypothetical protein